MPLTLLKEGEKVHGNRRRVGQKRGADEKRFFDRPVIKKRKGKGRGKRKRKREEKGKGSNSFPYPFVLFIQIHFRPFRC